MRAMTERDFDTLEELVHPDLQLRSLLANAGSSFDGMAGLRTYFDEIDGSFDDVRWKLLDVVAVGDDVAVVRVHFHAAGRGSRIEIDEIHPQIWRWRDGRGYYNEVHLSLDDALESAGLEP